jgi:hypothetical protein
MVLVKERISRLLIRMIVWGLVFEKLNKKKFLFLKKDIIFLIFTIILLYIFTEYYWNYNMFDTSFAEEIKEKQENQPNTDINNVTLWKKILLLITICLGLSILIKWGFSITQKIDDLTEIIRQLELKNNNLINYINEITKYINDVAKKSFNILEHQANGQIDVANHHEKSIEILTKRIDAISNIVLNIADDVINLKK